jgi:hypothetical protein
MFQYELVHHKVATFAICALNEKEAPLTIHTKGPAHRHSIFMIRFRRIEIANHIFFVEDNEMGSYRERSQACLLQRTSDLSLPCFQLFHPPLQRLDVVG